jgi:hypothetical protein
METTGKDINALRREKESALLLLGKMMHKLIRDGKISDDACFRLSEQIAQIDVDLCIAVGDRVPGQGEGICPNCGSVLAAQMAAFCGACGMNIAEYYSRNTVRCEKCNQITAMNGHYCTVCGCRRTAQGGGTYDG